MESHMMRKTSAAETTVDGSNNQHHVIQVDSHQEYCVKELSPQGQNWKDEGLSKHVTKYLDSSHKTINFDATVVQPYLDSAHNYSSLVNNHSLFLNELDSDHRKQVLSAMSQQSFKHGLVQNLNRVAKAWTIVSYAALATVAVLTVAACITGTHAIREVAALASLVNVFIRWIDLRLRKYEDGVKNHVAITNAMAIGTRITINGLASLRSWASKMAESANSGEVKKKDWMEIIRKGADFGRDIRLARELPLQIV